MMVVVFRARRTPEGDGPAYKEALDRMARLARTMPGYISHKSFYAEDGERCTIVEFAHEEGLRTWRPNPRFARSIASRSSSCRSRRKPRLDRRRPRLH